MIGDVIVSDTPISLGQRIRIHRVILRWRQEDLAVEADVPPHVISLMERDLPVYPAAKARVLKVLDLREFLDV